MDCTHAENIFVDTVVCGNTDDLIHAGVVPRAFCDSCPYRAARGSRDYFQQTHDLIIRRHRQGRFVAASPCECAGQQKSTTREQRMKDAFRDVLGGKWKSVAENRARSGDGIIIVGGGDYWPGIVVSIRMLRLVGCSLPVEVWHYGKKEPVDPDEVADCGEVIFRDLSIERRRPLRGWPAKVHAIACTQFERALFLDADAYCVADPTELIHSADAPFRYWQDLPGNANSINWAAVWPHSFASDETVCGPVQGGHLLIDINAAWQLICATLWMNRHSKWYYRFMFGDQDTWRLAAVAIGDNSLLQCLGPSVQRGGSIVVGTGSNSPMIVHRCSSKLFPPEKREHDSRVWDGVPCDLPRESDMIRFFSEFVQWRVRRGNCSHHAPP